MIPASMIPANRLRLVFLFALSILLLAVQPIVASKKVDLPEKVTFSEHVAPVLYENCVSCHRAGDVAPMSLLTYDEARPWAKSIRRAVSEGEMPPWDADPRYGDFSNDISLSEREIALISRWVDQGAPHGDPRLTPPPPGLPEAGSWKMGSEPDYTIELAPVSIPADGPDHFITQVYAMDLPPGKWVRAIELLPDNSEILHHVVTYLGPFGMSDDEEEEVSNSGIQRVIYLNEGARRPVGMAEAPSIGGVYVAGSPPSRFREGTGHPLKEDQRITLNMHYHPSGTAGTDASKVGFYYGEGELEKEIVTAFAADPGIWIPAGAEDHRESAVYLFAQDSHILSLLPHQHQRGKSMKYTLIRPDGSEEVLLNVPKYDYDWQNIYHLREPVSAPAGSLVRVEAGWDNSADNPANPDPDVDVSWGDGTNDEMLVAFVDFVVDEGLRPRPVRINQQIDRLLGLHAAEHAYSVRLDGMGFGGNWGLVVPPEGDGTLYMLLGPLMFSTSIPGVERVGDEILLNGSIIASGGGTRVPLGFLAKIAKDGSISGEVFFGQELRPDNLADLRGQGRAFSGKSRAAAEAVSGGR